MNRAIRLLERIQRLTSININNSSDQKIVEIIKSFLGNKVTVNQLAKDLIADKLDQLLDSPFQNLKDRDTDFVNDLSSKEIKDIETSVLKQVRRVFKFLRL